MLAGRDVLGCAQTGTGKTAAFALPIIDRLTESMPEGKQLKMPRCLVLCPTRELAAQIAEGFEGYAAKSPLRSTVIFGGVRQRKQVETLRRGVDILIATPGRLLDLVQQGHVDLGHISVLVLDEADRMLDMGFIPDIRRIVAKIPRQRQTLLFSATMPPAIQSLADSLLRDPVDIRIKQETPLADGITQTVHFVDRPDKADLLARLIRETPMARVLVFTRTKHGADRLVKQLRMREIRSEAIHGDKDQKSRERTLGNFRTDRVSVMVATDIAARGLDVDDVTHVVNFDIPEEAETYIHRVGRTARAGASGWAVSLCCCDEILLLRGIERLLGHKIPPVGDVPLYARPPVAGPAGSGRRHGRSGRMRGRQLI